MTRRVVILAVWILASMPTFATAQGITAMAVPDTVALSPKRAVTVHLIVVNGGTRPMRNVRLSPLRANAAGLSATVHGRDARTIAAGHAERYLLRIRTDSPILFDHPLSVLVSYDDRGASWTMATIKVTPTATVEPAAIASMQIKASLGDLRSGRSVPVRFVVTNKTGERLTAGPITLQLPDSLEASETAVAHLQPYETRVLGVALSAHERVRPGKHQVVFTAAVRVDDKPPSLLLVDAQEVTVAVEGEGPLLAALGVPALVLVPGLLVLGMPLLLWKLRVLRHKSDPDVLQIDPLSVPFVALSAVVSVVVVWLWGLTGTDLLDYYSHGDILRVAGASAVAGCFLYVVPMALRYVREARRTPKRSDTPLITLRKLARQGIKVHVPTYQQPRGRGYMLQPPSDDRPSTWFSPVIALTWDVDDEPLHEAVLEARDTADNPGQLADVLQPSIKAAKLTLKWDSSDGQGPYLVPKNEFGENPMTDAILRFDN